MSKENLAASAPVHQLVGRVLSRFYDLPLGDPIHVVANYDHGIPDGGELMGQGAHEHIAGVTIAAHGCEGSVWLQWEDVPVLIEALSQALRDVPPNAKDQGADK